MPADNRSDTAGLRLVVLLLPLALVVCGATTTQGQTPPCRITAMKAMLFYDNNGTFSADVAGEDDGVFVVPSILWNTPIEGASRVGASTSLLATVEVTGESQYATSRKIVFTASYVPLNQTRRTVITKTAPIRIGEGGKLIAGFWLAETGCNPVKLSARIVGQKGSSQMRKVIKFGCGE